MAVFSKDIGQLSNNKDEAIRQLLDYIVYMKEAVEFDSANMKRRITTLENK